MIDMNFNVLEEGIEATRIALRDSVLSIDIWDRETGLSLVDWRGNPTGVALLSQMSVELDDTLEGSDFPKLKDYFFIDLKDGRALVVINHGDNIFQGWLLDSKKANPGILIGIAIPKAISNVAIAKGKA